MKKIVIVLMAVVMLVPSVSSADWYGRGFNRNYYGVGCGSYGGGYGRGYYSHRHSSLNPFEAAAIITGIAVGGRIVERIISPRPVQVIVPAQQEYVSRDMVEKPASDSASDPYSDEYAKEMKRLRKERAADMRKKAREDARKEFDDLYK